MLRRIRARLTYANVMVTVLALVVLGGGAAYAANTVFSSDIVNGEVYSVDVRNDTLTGGGLVAADLRADSVASSEVHDDSLTGTDIREATLGKVRNAGKLDGLDSGAFIKGGGKIAFIDQVIPENNTGAAVLDLPWVVIGSACAGTSANGHTDATNVTTNPMEVFVDVGGAKPLHLRLNQAQGVSVPTDPGGDELVFSVEQAGKQVIVHLFSSAFHNPVLNEDDCQYHGYALINAAGE